MSTYKSPFISGSEDSQYSPGVAAHFSGPAGAGKPNSGSPYTRKWGSKDAMAEFLNSETGVNHKHNGAKGSYPRG
jgi:hypothetical protein